MTPVPRNAAIQAKDSPPSPAAFPTLTDTPLARHLEFGRHQSLSGRAGVNAMHRARSVLRIALVTVLGFCIWNAGAAKATDIEVLMVPSAAMGRDIPVAFLAGGPHAAFLLDGFNAAPDVSNWVTAGNG